MIRLLVQYNDDKALKELQKYGDLVYVSKLMKVVGLETNVNVDVIKKIPGVISARPSQQGKLMPVQVLV